MAQAAKEPIDYSLTGKYAGISIENGLAEADWYTSFVPKDKMRQLLERKNGPAVRDTLIWFVLIFSSGYFGFIYWGTIYAILPFFIYGALYASTADSRWHESSHGTAFKSDWMNEALYEIASFMVMRESTPWRWSHTRHHSDTIIIGRDPEIAVPRPPDLWGMFLNIFSLKVYPVYWKRLIAHSFGKMDSEEITYIPKEAFSIIYLKARLHLLVYIIVVGLAIYFQSILPLMYIGLPHLFGTWLMVLYGTTQHAGLAENVLDHRLNCRTVYMNPIHRYFYWNMNYHLEHHMFPLVPYHKLPELHQLIKADTPMPYNGIIETYKEIIPTLFKQVKDPGFFIKRILPAKSTHKNESVLITSQPDSEGWLNVGNKTIILTDDVIRLDYNESTFALYKTNLNEYYCTDGICTHGNTHLSEGFIKGNVIECAKHNGRFNIKDGSPQRAPVCVKLATYPVKCINESLYINIKSKKIEKRLLFKVVSNENVATFIKELKVEPLDGALDYKPGNYLQFVIPTYSEIKFSSFNVKDSYLATWQNNRFFDNCSKNTKEVKRNYSFASNPTKDSDLFFTIRIATPPVGQNCAAGVGSSYMWNLKEGDKVEAIGPFGDFTIKDTQKEMVYIGGGAGMAPLRAHISYLLETRKSNRKISFWYGARSEKELFYLDFFNDLELNNPNFKFHVGLSETDKDVSDKFQTGYIHTIVAENYLAKHSNLANVEFYLCGPPLMIKAMKELLLEYGVTKENVMFDEF